MPVFRFKQFSVRHDRSGMKVGTDGVMLGAWVRVHENLKRILDVGTGTGLIALMLAQRCAARIDAIEIHAEACREARQNVHNSPWPGQINIEHRSLQEYVQTGPRNYDLVISNPPYYRDAWKPETDSRALARHTGSLSPEVLAAHASKILTSEGRLALILPSGMEDEVIKIASQHSLFPLRLARVRPTPEKAVIRVLLELQKNYSGAPDSEEFAIEIKRHVYTLEYMSLTGDFYLNL